MQNNFSINTTKDMRMASEVYIGLMSGTSLDGVDGVLVQLPDPNNAGATLVLLVSAHHAFSPEFQQQALALQQAGENEIQREALLANELAHTYAACVASLRRNHAHLDIRAIGAHGQTIRHRPELGFTRQTNNPALLAELTGIDVVADFRSRDIAAGGQGAPLVPAFHRAVFGAPDVCRVVVNIGGISNISVLHADGGTTGFDTGPGNVLMDAWVHRHHQKPYDEDGAWAAQGQTNPALLAVLSDEAFLKVAPPKSTGRDLFHMAWLLEKLALFGEISAVDVQATLCAFTVKTIVDAIQAHAPHCEAVFVCGGGAYNCCLMQQLSMQLSTQLSPQLSPQSPAIVVTSTAALGVNPQHVEALAFAWLAQRFSLRLPGNLSAVTGAKGERILGALYPA